MTIAVILILSWVLLAYVIASSPSADNHWRLSYVLMAIGAPLLVWITWQHGFLFGFAGLVIGGLVLRWPVYYLWGRMKSLVGQ